MKLIFIPFFLQALTVLAADHKFKAVRKIANEACFTTLKEAVVELESKTVNVGANQIKTGEQRLLGKGAGLFLYTIFVESPSTADNTHWEIVGELNLADESCKAVFSKRFEAP